MVNQKHYARLKKDVEAWNKWRANNLNIIPDLSEADLSEALSEADLIGANLTRSNLNGAVLTGAKLIGTNLTRTNLTRANLSGANLSGANLSGANLSRTQVLGTVLTNAKFTGACLEDWNINSATKLNDIDCQYIYLKSDKQERRPSRGVFAVGEFTKLFQKVLERVDLISTDELDWEAFLLYCEEVLQAIENKSATNERLKIQFSGKMLPSTLMLTLEQSALIPIYKEKWKKILISSDIIDRSKAKANTILLYRSIGLSKPQIIFVDTPYIAVDIILKEFWKLVLENHTDTTASFGNNVGDII